MPTPSPVVPTATDLQHVLETVFMGKGSVAAPKFGLGVTPVVKQSAITAVATTAATNSSPYGFSQAQANAIVTAINSIITTLQAFGLTS